MTHNNSELMDVLKQISQVSARLYRKLEKAGVHDSVVSGSSKVPTSNSKESCMKDEEKVKALEDIIELGRRFDFAFDKVRPLMEMKKELEHELHKEEKQYIDCIGDFVSLDGFKGELSERSLALLGKWIVMQVFKADKDLNPRKERIRRLVNVNCPNIILANERRILTEDEHWLTIGDYLDTFELLSKRFPDRNDAELLRMAKDALSGRFIDMTEEEAKTVYGAR